MNNKNMIFITTLLSSCILLNSCNNNGHPTNLSTQSHSPKVVAKTECYKYNDKFLFVEFNVDGNGEFVPVSSSAADLVTEVLNSPTSICINYLGSDTFWIDKNSDKIESVFKQSNRLNKVKTAKDVTVYEQSQYGGESMQLTQSMPDFYSYGFNDKISSLTFRGIGLVLCYENPNYGGKSIGFYQSLSESQTYYVSNFNDLCMKKTLWWCSQSWNDQISSIKF